MSSHDSVVALVVRLTAALLPALALTPVAVFALSGGQVPTQNDQIAQAEFTNLTVNQINSMPLVFTENQGQWDERVKFLAKSGGATIWFTEEGVHYQFLRRIEDKDSDAKKRIEKQFFRRDPGPRVVEQSVIRASFVGSRPNPIIRGRGLTGYECNYFISSDPSKWHAHIPNYEAIVLEDIYEGIDLMYYGTGRQMEYDFVVSPGADYSQIQIRYSGAKSLKVAEDGALVVATEWGEIRELAPVVYQEIDGSHEAVRAEYVIHGDDTFGIHLGSEYDPTLEVTIDPVVVYSTYLGGSDEDNGYSIAVDENGCAYVTGRTYSTDFPTENPFQTDQGEIDVFVTKLSASGNSLIYSSYLGGSGNDEGYGIAVDGSGCAHVTGITYSTDFPVENPYQTDQGGLDVFVTKLSASGDMLAYSTYLGGDSGDWGYGIDVDAGGYAYLTGSTESTNFPTENPFQPNQGSSDAFVAKLSPSGNSLVYSTYLGGSSDDDLGLAIDVDGGGYAYVTGITLSTDFPTLNPYQTDQGFADVFVAKLNSSGSSLVYSTYLGGNTNWEFGLGIAVDNAGCAYVTGETYSSDFPTQNPYQTDHPLTDAFVTKLSASGNSLIYSTYLGGDASDMGLGIKVDAGGCAYVTGKTFSTDFPTVKPYQTDTDHIFFDAFVTKLEAPGNSLAYSTYLGGDADDWARGIAIDGAGCCYVTGETWSVDFPTENHYQTDQNGSDVFVTKISGFICGDADGSGGTDIDDAVYLVNFIFSGGPSPNPLESGDADCSGGVDIDDVVYLINYIFSGGNPPGDPDGDGISDC